MRRSSILIFSALVTAGAVCPAHAQPGAQSGAQSGEQSTAQRPTVIRSRLAAEIPFLASQSTWRQDTVADETGARRGIFPVGNGRVSACFGAGPRANTMRAITGPNLSTAATDRFGSCTLELHAASGEIDLSRRRVRRLRGISCVVTEDANDDLALRTITFAPIGIPELWRIVEVERLRGAATDLQLIVTSTCAVSETQINSLQLRCGPANAPRFAAISMTGAQPSGRNSITTRIDALESSNVWRGVVRTATATKLTTAMINPPTVADARASLEAAHADWQRRLAAAPTSFETDHAKLADLFADWKINLSALRCARSGLVIAPNVDREVSVRDNNGVLLALLRFGMWAEAKAILQYWDRATRVLGRVPETLPADLDFSGVDDRRIDWKSVRVPQSEVPAWLLLQHYWYWRATRDTRLIDEHWPLLDVCLKRQARSVDDLLPFHGGEPFLHVTGNEADSLAIAHDDARERSSWSLVSGTLMLLATQATGEMLTARKSLNNSGSTDSDSVDPYRLRMFKMLQNVESRYWLADEGYFAPALSPIGDEPHREPFANANLTPLWAGWTFPSGEKSRDNLRNSLARLWRAGARIGTTSTLPESTGDLQGMLLVALSERDCTRRMDVLDSLLELAEPAGAWAAKYDATGRPMKRHGAEAEAFSVGPSGVNLDAIAFATTGVRQASVPAWDMRDIRLELRLPTGAERFAMLDHGKDGRRLSIRFDRETHLMSAEEIEANAKLEKEKRRDPNALHPQIHFQIELLAGEPPDGYYDVALNAGGTVYVRYLSLDPKQNEGEHDFRRIDERGYLDPDTERFLPDGAFDAPVALQPRPIPAGRVDAVLLTNRPNAAARARAASIEVFDTGLPFTASDLKQCLFDSNGMRRADRLLFDWGCATPFPSTAAPSSAWQSQTWTDALSRFRADGGEVIHPAFFRRGVAVAEDGSTTEFDAPTDSIEIAPTTRLLRFESNAPAAGKAVVRIGSDLDLTVRVNGKELGAHAAGSIAPDRSAFAVDMPAGSLTVELEVRTPARGMAFVRITDPDGLPLVEAR